MIVHKITEKCTKIVQFNDFLRKNTMEMNFLDWQAHVLNSLNIYPAFFVRCWIFIIFVLDYANKT